MDCKRVALAGEVWDWCAWEHGVHGTYWHAYLLLEKLERTYGNPEFDNWKAVDLHDGEVVTVYSVPAMGWEKLE